MLAMNTGDAFAHAVREGKISMKDKIRLEPVLVDTMPLRHGAITGILIGGLGPDVTAPGAYTGWANSDLAGGVYVHPRLPGWYVSPNFVQKFRELEIYSVIERYFVNVIDINSPKEVLRAIWHLSA